MREKIKKFIKEELEELKRESRTIGIIATIVLVGLLILTAARVMELTDCVRSLEIQIQEIHYELGDVNYDYYDYYEY